MWFKTRCGSIIRFQISAHGQNIYVRIPIMHSIDYVWVGQSQLQISIHLRQSLKSNLKMSKRNASEESAEINEDPAKKSRKFYTIEYKLKLLKDVKDSNIIGTLKCSL